MTLSERLAAAERARAGLLTEEASVSPPTVTSSATPAVPAALPSEMAILLGPQQPVAAVTPDPAVPRHAVCPTCGRTGELGLVDLARRTGDWSCDTCGTLWRISQR